MAKRPRELPHCIAAALAAIAGARSALAVACVALLVASPTDARADDDDLSTTNVRDELTAGATAPGKTSPRSAYVSDALSGALGLSEAWFVRAGATATRDVEKSAPAETGFGSQGGNVFAFLLGGTLKQGAWVFALDADLSPSSVTLAPTTVSVTGPRGETVDVDAQLSAASSSVGGNATIRWHAIETDKALTVVGLDVTPTSLTTTQKIVAYHTRDGSTVTSAQVLALCNNRPAACSKSELAILTGVSTSLVQARIAPSVTETIAKDTDLGVTGAYYAYTKDPTTAGYFTLTQIGRTRTSFGGGLPIAPVQLSVELDAAHRFGRFEPSIGLVYARYVSDQGYALSATAQGKLAMGDHASLWLRLGVQRDVDAEDESLRTLSVAVGFRWTF